MLFHSAEFLIGFLPVVFCGYLLLAHFHCYRSALVWLTAASLVFYAWWNPVYLWLIAGSILGNFAIGRLITTQPAPWRNWCFLAGISLNLLALGYFKYANFFVANLNHFLHLNWNFEKVILPLAVSFFTFTQIAYLVDSFRGETKRYGLLEYSFFVTFFPHLIAGPIVLHKEIMPQVEREGVFRFAWSNLQVGLGIFVIGLFKKVVLADGCAEYVTPFFEVAKNGYWVSTPEAWCGVLAYTFQLYFDFSGYSDMAIGISRVFGILLPLNFDSPYRATNIIDFWRRWHISLSRFLRNYLYIPLGGNRRGIVLKYSNLFITMLIGGLWHGAGWTFVIWGGLHGLYLVINHGFKALSTMWNPGRFVPKPVGRLFGWSLTMLAVIVGWVFFRSANVETAGRIISMMTGLHDHPVTYVFQLTPNEVTIRFFWIVALAAIALALPNTQQYFGNFQPALDAREPLPGRWRFVWKPNFLHGAIMGVFIFMIARRLFQLAPSDFLYFNF
ncbi:MAG: MBOAT family O-acyltransferase [Terrimicrobiaceae bacterium]